MKKEHIEIINKFGQRVIDWIRDKSFESTLRVLNGDVSIEREIDLYEKSLELSDAQKETLKKYVFEAIDNTIFNFFYMIEQSDIESDKLDLILYTDKEKKEYLSLIEISDGLYGDMLGLVDEGKSKYPPSF